jgi:PhnB protein
VRTEDRCRVTVKDGGELMANVVAAHLVLDDPERAAAWYGTVFGAQETDRIPLPDGSIFAIDLAIGDTTIALAGEYLDMGIISPKTLGGTYLALVVSTDNADEVWARAVESGATVFHPISDTFYGERAGQFIDPFGHRWGVSQHLRNVPREERDAAVAAMFSSG